MKKVLVIGASGLVGSHLCPHFENNQYQVVKASRTTHPAFDLMNFEAADFSSYKAVILTANLAGGVNFCEKNPELSYGFHFMATKKIADAAKVAKTKLIFISTDYVFPDHLQDVAENHPPSALNQYGKDKSSAEKYIINHLEDYLIIRTTNVFGWDPLSKTPNYLMNFYHHLSQNQIFRSPKNVFCTPTNVSDLVSCLFQLFNAKQKGIFHVVGDEYMTRFDWLTQACAIFKFPNSLLQGFEDTATSPSRPLNLKLSNQKVKSTIQYEFKNLKSSLIEISQKIK